MNSDLILVLKMIESREENQRLTRKRLIFRMQIIKLMQLKTTLQETNKKLKRDIQDIQEINEQLNK